jgi:hypothetical protein
MVGVISVGETAECGICTGCGEAASVQEGKKEKGEDGKT